MTGRHVRMTKRRRVIFKLAKVVMDDMEERLSKDSSVRKVDKALSLMPWHF
jgi:hypothetical protein